MENQLMWAELANGVTIQMLNDPKTRIISDTGLFLITYKSNISAYPNLNFIKADNEALEAYNNKL